tara:strand:+ start:182 stop:712 length:531 start_codon:yes stop_codon:yes gene_type:complete
MGSKKTFSLFLSLCLFSCGSDSNLDLDAESTQIYDNEIKNPKINIYQQHNMVVQSTSNTLLKNDGEDATLVGNVIAKFFNDDGNYISTLYSDSAIVENISNNLRAYGNVKVISDSGYTLLSDQINWDNQYKLITSKDSVTLTDKSNTTVMGVGFESDMDLTNYKIFKFIGSFEDSK